MALYSTSCGGSARTTGGAADLGALPADDGGASDGPSSDLGSAEDGDALATDPGSPHADAEDVRTVDEGLPADPGGDVVPDVGAGGEDVTSGLPDLPQTGCATLDDCLSVWGNPPPCIQFACDPGAGRCQWSATSEGFPCGDVCSGQGTCEGGVCHRSPAPDCNDGNDCTNDGCAVATGGCTHTPVTGPCDDLDSCTGDGTCVDTVCTKGAPMDCDDGEECTLDACVPGSGCVHQAFAAGTTCDDGDPCTEGDRCVQGACVPENPNPCDDGEPCTEDLCDATGQCLNTAVADGTGCGPGASCAGNAWTSATVCQGGKCTAGKPVTCVDALTCTKDSCDAAAGCVHEPDASACDDGLVCTTDGCDVVGGCTHDVYALYCAIEGKCRSDGVLHPDNPCAKCDWSADQTAWTALADGTKCGVAGKCEGLSWTPADSCAAGVCSTGTARSCDDGVACTDDTCNPDTGCRSTPNAARCDDEVPCTKDACGALGCEHVTDSTQCDDGVGCTTDTCTNGGCTHVADAVPCDDKLACTTDACSPTTGCSNTLVPSACVIGGACRTEGQNDGANTCRACVSATSVTAWTNVNEGKVCAADACGDWSTCSGYVEPCGETGTQKRTCTKSVCKGGTCQATTTTESRSCTRDTDGSSCTVSGSIHAGTCASAACSCSETIRMVSGSCSSHACTGSDTCKHYPDTTAQCTANCDASSAVVLGTFPATSLSVYQKIADLTLAPPGACAKEWFYFKDTTTDLISDIAVLLDPPDGITTRFGAVFHCMNGTTPVNASRGTVYTGTCNTVQSGSHYDLSCEAYTMAAGANQWVGVDVKCASAVTHIDVFVYYTVVSGTSCLPAGLLADP